VEHDRRVVEPDGARAKFVALLDASGAAHAAADALWLQVAERYGEPPRHYHTLAHAVSVAERVETLALAARLSDPRAALLAAWLHDAVYDIGAADNEAASADYAVEHLTAVNVDPTLVTRCADLIRATADHTADDIDAAVLCDADLAILAADAGRYREYTELVRAEYAAIPGAEFRRGRAAILRALLSRDRLYRTPGAKAWEQPARRNLERELRALIE
jgi:predicted metal-dependent HD superfamily phosphohydrolase